MKKHNNFSIIIICFGLLFFSLTSCKKDLDHELNYNVFDSDYEAVDPATILYFQPVWSQVHQRNVLKIKIGFNAEVKGGKAQIFKDGTFMTMLYSDTTTIGTDFWALPGETHNYQALIYLDGFNTILSVPKSFLMY